MATILGGVGIVFVKQRRVFSIPSAFRASRGASSICSDKRTASRLIKAVTDHEDRNGVLAIRFVDGRNYFGDLEPL